MDDPTEAIERARQASEVLNHPMFQEAFNLLERRYIEAIRTSPQRDVEGRETVVLMLKQLGSVRAVLEEVINTGTLARREWERQRTMRERMHEWRENLPWIG